MKPCVTAHSLADRMSRYISELHILFAALIAAVEAKLWSYVLRKAIGKDASLAPTITGKAFIVFLLLSFFLLLAIYLFQLLPMLPIVQSIDIAYGVTGKGFFQRKMPATDPREC